jgi:hypothetical protein
VHPGEWSRDTQPAANTTLASSQLSRFSRSNEVFAYVLEAGLALRDYKAVVTLTPNAAGGTAVNWHSTFWAKVPGTGGIYRRQLGAFIGDTVQGLVAAADRARVPEPPVE